MAPAQKIRAFKILSAIIVLLLLTWLAVLAKNVIRAPDMAAYALNDSINRRNQDFANLNPFGFTDQPRNKVKPKGTYRIAVLGDSFVWGDGVPYNQAWGHKLEQKILARYDSVEVMNWGRCGWSTLDEFNFFKQYGKDYDVDLLIIGWVVNDPDMGNYALGSTIDAKKHYPTVSRLWPWLAQYWTNGDEQSSSHLWMDKLYAPANLSAYKNLLIDLRNYTAAKQVKVLMVLTPNPSVNSVEDNFKKIKPIIDSAGLICLDLLPMQRNTLKKYSELQLSANPVNCHPGTIMTGQFATEVQAYLEANGYLTGLHLNRNGI
jgi:hypothetical protein